MDNNKYNNNNNYYNLLSLHGSNTDNYSSSDDEYFYDNEYFYDCDDEYIVETNKYYDGNISYSQVVTGNTQQNSNSNEVQNTTDQLPTSEHQNNIDQSPTSEHQNNIDQSPTSEHQNNIDQSPTSEHQNNIDQSPTSEHQNNIDQSPTSEHQNNIDQSPTSEHQNNIDQSPTSEHQNNIDQSPTSEHQNNIDQSPTSEHQNNIDQSPTSEHQNNGEIINNTKNHNKDKNEISKKNTTKNIQNTTIYIILSCAKGLKFTDIEIVSDKNNINTIDIELVEITSETLNKNDNNLMDEKTKNNQDKLKRIRVKEYNDSFENKNIYLYKANIELKSNEENFNIRFIYNNELIQSDSNLTIQQYQQLFLYSLHYIIIDKKSGQFKKFFKKAKNFMGFDDNNKILKDLMDEKYKLSNLQKFIIYKKYLVETNMKYLIPNLLVDTQNTIVQPNKKNIEIRKYDNEEYIKLISLMESHWYISFKGKSHTGYHMFILMFYQFNKIENFKSFLYNFNKIQAKQDVIDFIIKHKNLFPNLNFNNLKLIFENANKNKTSINDVLILSSNFNEYLKFFCSQEYFIEKKVPKIQFNRCPKPNEHVDVSLLERFIKILLKIDLDHTDLNHIKDNFIILINCFNGKIEYYGKLKELKGIFLKYKDINNIVNIILDRIDDALHYT
eukprot:jgi/Orpsp1_1/1190297/evm.model.d7180000078079.1